MEEALAPVEEGNQTLGDWKGDTQWKDKSGKVVYTEDHKKCNTLLAAWKGVLSSKMHDKPGEALNRAGKPVSPGGYTQEHMYPKDLRYTPEGGTTKGNVLFLTPEDDHNGAFAMNTQLCEWLACWAGKGYGVLAQTVGSVAQAIKTVKGFKAKTLAHVVLSGHGFQQGLMWGKDSDPDSGLMMRPPPGQHWTLQKHQNRAASTATLLKELNSKLAADASVVVDACSTGQGSGASVEKWRANGSQGPDPLDLETLKRNGHQNLFEEVKINVGERTVWAPTRPYSVEDYKRASEGLDKGGCSPDTKGGHTSPYTWAGGEGKVVRALVELNQESAR